MNANSRIWPLLLCIAAVGLLVFLGARNTGLYPIVYDEFVYNRFSRLESLSASTVPSFLYLSFFGLPPFSGDGFLNSVRVTNAVIFIAAVPCIYLTARLVAGRALSSWVALLAVLGPVNS